VEVDAVNYNDMQDRIIVYFSSHALVAIVTLLVYVRYFGGC
jgi:hypothetical protein